MAGHSKWASIKHKKKAVDAKRGQLFTKLTRAITVAAREGGGDPEGNPRCARDPEGPRRQHAQGQHRAGDRQGHRRRLRGRDLRERSLYEGYGPGGVAILVEALTDNRNRTGAEVRNMFTKSGGSLGEPGSVAWTFEKKGEVVVDGHRYSEDDLLAAIDAGAEDLIARRRRVGDRDRPGRARRRPRGARGRGRPARVRRARRCGPPPARRSQEDQVGSLMRLIEGLEDHDDVQAVHANFDVDADVLERVAASARRA